MPNQEKSMFNMRGLIPPFYDSPTSSIRSPYPISLARFVRQFSIGCARFNTARRLSLLRGLLSYRKMLHDAGIIYGYQWVNGSFVTYKELMFNEAPNDIDVLNIVILPEGDTQESFSQNHNELFSTEDIKQSLHVDAYYLCLDPHQIELASLLDQVNYWNNLWSHQRDTLLWKGYFQLDISPDGDRDALEELEEISKGVENATT